MSAGVAKTSSFLLGSATVMLGPQADLFDLRPDLHSIGLVKNFQITAEPTTIELTQGVKNQIVYSAVTGNRVQAQCEVFEYTSKNLMYALGLDGSTFVAYSAEYNLKTAITGSTSSPVTTAVFDNVADVDSSFPVGAWISIQDPSLPDTVHYAKLTDSTVTGAGPFTHTLTFANHGLKDANNFPVNSKIQRVNLVPVGSTDAQPFLAMKVVGLLPEKNEPVGLLLPKVRITRGFTVAFTTENFGNMPFQFQPYELVSTDPFYSQFASVGPAKLFAPT